jgi:hypothetical protein
MIQPTDLIASADEIDNRLGPIPGRSSDRIARELRAAAALISELQGQISVGLLTDQSETTPPLSKVSS